MPSFVLDCSVAISWLIDDERSAQTDSLLERLQEEKAFIPALWHLEIGNVLIQAERRRRLSPQQTDTALRLLESLPLETVPLEPRELPALMALAREQKLTVYDACYLHLAQQKKRPLATLDRELRTAAARLGVTRLP